MTIDYAKLRALAKKATPGPWGVQPHEHWKSGVQVYAVRAFAFIAECGIGESDAAYISAASPDVVVALLDEIERLRDELRIERNARSVALDALAAVESARRAARALSARISDLGAFVDDSDPRAMSIAGPLGEAEADLFVALGLDVDATHAEMMADIDSRCAVCGWPLSATREDGCIRGNCSYRPRPERLYAPERAAAEQQGEGK